MTPARIQRKRTRGWKMPPNTVYVGRPTKWGNPYRVTTIVNAANAVRMYRRYVLEEVVGGRLDLEELRGKDLACFCRVGEPCHADVLLELANVKAGREDGQCS